MTAAASLPDYQSCLDVPFEHVLSYWDRVTHNMTDVKAIRALALWDRYFLLVMVIGRHDMLHPWLYARCREVEADPDGHLDLWSREHYKSTIITYAGIIQEVLRNPEITVGIFSHNRAVATKFLVQIKNELQGHEKLKQLFPDVLYSNPEAQSPQWNQTALVVKRKTNPKESTIEAWGLVDGSPIGAHFMLVVMDDLVTEASVNTPEQIAKTTDAWELSDNLGVAEGGRRWMIGTRYHFSDTYDAVAKKGTVKLRIYPATDDGTEVGNPVLWSPEVWAEKKINQGPKNTACQLLLNPNAGQQGMFEVEDIREYEIRPGTLNVYITCDPARSKKTDSDRTAMSVIGVDYALNKYLLDGFNHKMDLQERWEHLAMLFKKWKMAPGVQHLKVGYEIYGAQADMDYFKEQMKLPDNPRFPIEELAWPREGPGSKVDRVQRLGPDFRKGKFFVPAPLDPNKLTKAQQGVVASGYAYRVSKVIRRRDEEKRMYDLTDHFKSQVTYFPHFGKKDLVDAVSRIYDMEILAPTYQEPSYAEPEIV